MAQANKAEELTVLVFKNNLASRTFQVPVRWISQFGILIGVVIFLTLVFFVVALKYFRHAQLLDPSRLAQLERTNEALKNEIDTLKKAPPVAEAKPAPVPVKQTETVVPDQPIVQTSEFGNQYAGYLHAFPATIEPQSVPPNVPITLTNVKVNWRGNQLKTRFYIHYSEKDGGSQQGRFMILARGPSSIRSYPEQTIGSPSRVQEPMFSPEKGEYFSVSRFREVNASFGPYSKAENLEAVQVLLFDRKGKLIFAKALSVPMRPQIEQKKKEDQKPSQASDPVSSLPSTTNEATSVNSEATP